MRTHQMKDGLIAIFLPGECRVRISMDELKGPKRKNSYNFSRVTPMICM